VAEGYGVNWGDELDKLRTYLRDPSGNIWTDAFLRHSWNDVQQNFQHRTRVLEDVIAQRVPQLYHFGYMHDWEFALLPTDMSQFYQCLTRHGENIICHRWESQQLAGTTVDISDCGAHFTQAWEAYMGLAPGEVIRMKFPQNFNSVKFIAYDEEPIGGTTRKAVQSCDPSYVTTEGAPVAFYDYGETDNSYVLYPKPSVAFQSDPEGDGVAFYASGDTESDETGVIAVRDDSTPSAVFGASVDIVHTENNVFLVYDVSPNDLETISDEPDYPPFLRKYIRYGVLSRAYGSNTDGKIQSLADYWGARYDVGVECVKRYVRNRRTDRDYRLTTKGLSPRRNLRHPRLPDAYPAV